MRLLKNTGTDRVIDLLDPKLQKDGQLDVVTPEFSESVSVTLVGKAVCGVGQRYSRDSPSQRQGATRCGGCSRHERRSPAGGDGFFWADQ